MSARVPVAPRYGALTVLSEAQTVDGCRFMVVACDCGSPQKIVRLAHLRRQKIVSCGCIGRSACVTHGMSKSKTYQAWSAMCGRAKGRAAPAHYKDRGIDADPRWTASFHSFLSDMGECPTDHHELDRRNNNKGYWPGNCRWATRTEQMQNTRSNVWVILDGEAMIQAEAARRLGLNSSSFSYRARMYGWNSQRTVDYHSGIRRG